MSVSSRKSGTTRPGVMQRSPLVGRATLANAFLALGFAAAGIALALYLSGWFFLWATHADPKQASALTVLRYAHYFGDRREVRGPLVLAAACGFGMVTMGLVALAVPRRQSLHGDARFARRREIVAAGLLGQEGIVLGQLGRRYLMLGGQQGVALAAPPRAGKGTGVVIPNALNWPGSLVCVDIKRENWSITAGYRKSRGQACFLFDPLAEDGRTARWNPLSYVGQAPERRINDVQRIADMLYPEAAGTDPFWIASARSLFLGIALYLFETPSLPRTLGEVLRQGMASGQEGFGEHWKRLVEGRARGAHPLSGECVRALYDVIDLAPVTASSIRKTFTSRLELWQNPILDQATSGDDFDLRELRRRPMSIYVAVNPDDLHRLRPLVSLFFQQAIGLQTRELPEHNSSLKLQVMMLLDECAALGRIPIIAESISYLPGYNVRVVLVIQSAAQLRETYGPHNAETMLKSLAARIVYAPKDFSDAREISDELGFKTVRSKSQSRPRLGGFGGRKGAGGGSVTTSEQRRALLLPQEVKEIGPKKAIIFYEGLRPILCRKIRYFNDPVFQARLLPAPAQPTEIAQTDAKQSVAEPTARPETRSVDESVGISPSKLDRTVARASLKDIERIAALRLEDFAIDTSQVPIPEGRELTDPELENGVGGFLASFKG